MTRSAVCIRVEGHKGQVRAGKLFRKCRRRKHPLLKAESLRSLRWKEWGRRWLCTLLQKNVICAGKEEGKGSAGVRLAGWLAHNTQCSWQRPTTPTAPISHGSAVRETLPANSQLFPAKAREKERGKRTRSLNGNLGSYNRCADNANPSVLTTGGGNYRR